MNILTIDKVKQYFRIDYSDKDPAKKQKDDKIRDMATKAEDYVYKTIGKDYGAIVREYGKAGAIPMDIIQAAVIAFMEICFDRSPAASPVFNQLISPYKSKTE